MLNYFLVEVEEGFLIYKQPRMQSLSSGAENMLPQSQDSLYKDISSSQ